MAPGRRFAEWQCVRPSSDRDGVGDALRAIYGDVPQPRVLPEDFSRLLRMMG